MQQKEAGYLPARRVSKKVLTCGKDVAAAVRIEDNTPRLDVMCFPKVES